MFTLIGAVEAEEQTCASGITSAFTEHKPATIHSEERPGWYKTHRGSAGLHLLLAEAGQGTPASAEEGLKAAVFMWGSQWVCYLLGSNFSCLWERPVQQPILVWTSHTWELIIACVEELNRVALTWIIYGAYYRFKNSYLQEAKQKYSDQKTLTLL